MWKPILKIFSTLSVWYTQIYQTIFFQVLVSSTRLVIFSDFKELQIFQVLFSTLFVWYTQPLSDKYFLSIGFHKTCHFFWFQGIANISSFVFHTFCLIHPASVRRKISKYRFPQDLSFLLISRNCKFCFPHFLFDIPSLCQTKTF